MFEHFTLFNITGVLLGMALMNLYRIKLAIANNKNYSPNEFSFKYCLTDRRNWVNVSFTFASVFVLMIYANDLEPLLGWQPRPVNMLLIGLFGDKAMYKFIRSSMKKYRNGTVDPKK